MEQMRQNEAGALTAQAIPQKDVEQACFHALGLIGRNCEYLDQHLAHVGADQQTRQAVNDISAASARLDRTVNEVMSLLDFLRTGKGHTGSGDHSAVHRPHNGADGRAAYGRRYGTGTAASVPAAQYAGAGAAYHAGARRPGRAVMHAA